MGRTVRQSRSAFEETHLVDDVLSCSWWSSWERTYRRNWPSAKEQWLEGCQGAGWSSGQPSYELDQVFLDVPITWWSKFHEPDPLRYHARCADVPCSAVQPATGPVRGWMDICGPAQKSQWPLSWCQGLIMVAVDILPHREHESNRENSAMGQLECPSWSLTCQL